MDRSTADEDEARGDDDVALHHRNDELNRDGNEGQRRDDPGEYRRERGSQIGKECSSAGRRHQRPGYVDASRENVAGRHGPGSRCCLADQFKTVGDRRNPETTVDQ